MNSLSNFVFAYLLIKVNKFGRTRTKSCVHCNLSPDISVGVGRAYLPPSPVNGWYCYYWKKLTVAEGPNRLKSICSAWGELWDRNTWKFVHWCQYKSRSSISRRSQCSLAVWRISVGGPHQRSESERLLFTRKTLEKKKRFGQGCRLGNQNFKNRDINKKQTI